MQLFAHLAQSAVARSCVPLVCYLWPGELLLLCIFTTFCALVLPIMNRLKFPKWGYIICLWSCELLCSSGVHLFIFDSISCYPFQWSLLYIMLFLIAAVPKLAISWTKILQSKPCYETENVLFYESTIHEIRYICAGGFLYPCSEVADDFRNHSIAESPADLTHVKI